MVGVDLIRADNFYLVGIKGGGMTALALLLQGLGKKVAGSDTTEKFFTDEVLEQHNIKYVESFDSNEITDSLDVVIYSTAYLPAYNDQLQKAQKLGLFVVSYPEALGEIIKSKRAICVAGTHGKTTVTAILGYILLKAGFDPSVIVGSNVSQFSGNTLVGESDLLIVETDEYQNKFKFYNPDSLILNNVDWDHPDFFVTPDDYYHTFLDYIKKIPAKGWLVANIDDSNVVKLVKQAECQIITYSLDDKADWYSKDFKQDIEFQYFRVYKQGKLWSEAKSKLFGDFNIRNALAAIAAADRLGVGKDAIMSGLADFFGTARRWEIKGEYNGCKVVDDFAHHPGEIQATLKMARQRFKDKKIYTVFHPHTYTRTTKFKNEFAKSFTDCDEVIVLDIYASAREVKAGINSRDLTELIIKQSNNAIYLSSIDDATNYLKNELDQNSLLITMGAGDVWQVGENLISHQ